MKKEIEKLEIGGNIIYGYYDNDNNNFIIYNENNPAVISSKGTKTWYNHGKIHREDGPSVIYTNGLKNWFKHNKNITKKVKNWLEDRNLDSDNLTDEDKLALTFFMRGL